jgi:hypothetical protein
MRGHECTKLVPPGSPGDVKAQEGERLALKVADHIVRFARGNVSKAGRPGYGLVHGLRSTS